MPAIILAAGASRRLGQPKQLVRIAGETLLGRTIRVVRECTADPIVVVLGAHGEEIAAQVDLSFVHPVLNGNWEQGIASSIHTGIDALRGLYPEASGVLLLVCDQPRLKCEHLGALISAHQQTEEPAIVASEYAGVVGIPAIFPASQFGNLLALQGDHGARYLLRRPDCAILAKRFEGGEVDIDTPADLEEVGPQRC